MKSRKICFFQKEFNPFLHFFVHLNLQTKLAELERLSNYRKSKLTDNSAFLQFNWKTDVVESWISKFIYCKYVRYLAYVCYSIIVFFVQFTVWATVLYWGWKRYKNIHVLQKWWRFQWFKLEKNSTKTLRFELFWIVKKCFLSYDNKSGCQSSNNSSVLWYIVRTLTMFCHIRN